MLVGIKSCQQSSDRILEHEGQGPPQAMDFQRPQVLVDEYNRGLRHIPVEATLRVEALSKVVQEFLQFHDNLDLGAFDK